MSSLETLTASGALAQIASASASASATTRSAGHHSVHEAVGESTLGVDALAAERQLERDGRGHALGQPDEAAAGGHQAALDLGDPEAGVRPPRRPGRKRARSRSRLPGPRRSRPRSRPSGSSGPRCPRSPPGASGCLPISPAGEGLQVHTRRKRPCPPSRSARRPRRPGPPSARRRWRRAAGPSRRQWRCGHARG